MSHPQTPRTELTDYWRLVGAAGDIAIDYHPADARTPMRGESMDLQTVISGYSDPPANEWSDWWERYRALVESYGPHAGEFALHDVTGGPSFTETHSSTSLLVAIRPPADVPESFGAWTLVEDIEDRTYLRGRADLRFSLVYLAGFDQYDDAETLRSRLEVRGI